MILCDTLELEYGVVRVNQRVSHHVHNKPQVRQSIVMFVSLVEYPIHSVCSGYIL